MPGVLSTDGIFPAILPWPVAIIGSLFSHNISGDLYTNAIVALINLAFMFSPIYIYVLIKKCITNHSKATREKARAPLS
jgi:hypothetical protein